MDFVKASNDRKEKVLEFHHPEEMKRLLDLDVPETGLPLQQLIEDCATTLKYQVKTGELKCVFFFIIVNCNSHFRFLLPLYMVLRGSKHISHVL